MQVSSCLNPIYIRDYARKGFMQVPCGKCDGCKTSYGLHLAEKIDYERKFWKYCYFVTLTYEDKNLPILDESLESFILHPFDRTLSPRKSVREYYMYKDDFFGKLTKSDEFIIKKHREIFGGIPVLSHFHLTQFFKKLNNIIYYERYKFQQSSIRYIGFGEYGPASFRPHYHVFLFFDSPIIEREIEELVNKSWCINGSDKPLGITTIRPDSGTAVRYSSLYSTISVRMPTFLQFPFTRPFKIQSSRPAFGQVRASSIHEAQIFFSAATQITINDKYNSNPQLTPVDLPSNIKNKLFPRLPFFRDFSSDESLVLYRVYDYFPDFKTFYRFRFHGFRGLPANFVYSVRKLISLSARFSNISESDSIPLFQLLEKLWCVSKRFCRLLSRFGQSSEQTLYLIDRYYSNLELRKLKKFYELYESLSSPSSPYYIGKGNEYKVLKLYSDSQNKIPLTSAVVRLTDFPTFNSYKLRIKQCVQNGFVRKHANSNKRKLGRAGIYASAPL